MAEIPKAAGVPGQANTNVLEEWKECRSSIARFDQIISGIRKYGFTLVTALLTATAFIATPATTGSALSWPGKFAVSFAIAVLIYALFLVDRTYEIYLHATVQRGAKLEGQLNMALTKDIASTREKLHVNRWGTELYLLFMFANAILAIAATISPVQGIGLFASIANQWRDVLAIFIIIFVIPGIVIYLRREVALCAR